MRFIWDEAKNRSNQRKHDGISFELAATVFLDPLRVTRPERIEGGELRWQTFGMADRLLLLLVAHTIDDVDEHGEPLEIIRIISARRATPKEGESMGKDVSYTFETLPPLTDEQRQHLVRLAEMPPETIDLTDIPELTDAQLAELRPFAHYRPMKQQITARVDADVLAWLKSQGKGYQTLMNAILRREMLAHMQAKKG